MIVYRNPDGTMPKPRDMGLKDFYHDADGKYVGDPIIVPCEYKGNEQQYFIDQNKAKYGKDYVAQVPKYNEKQEYQLENEKGAENLAWARYHYAAKCEYNKEYENLLNNC